MGGSPNKWPKSKVEKLKRLHAAGLSATQIAVELDCGFSRCAVIGKIHRLMLEPIDHDQKPKRGPNVRPKRRKNRKNLVLIVSNTGNISFVKARLPGEEIRKPKLSPGMSKTSPAYRNQFGLAPETTPNQRRSILAEAMRNTAALQIAEASA